MWLGLGDRKYAHNFDGETSWKLTTWRPEKTCRYENTITDLREVSTRCMELVPDTSNGSFPH
jgi:hypothetical protein